MSDIMKIDGGAAEALRDRRFDNHRERPRAWTFETGMSSKYPSGEEVLYPPGTIQHENDNVYVDFNLWPLVGDDAGLVSLKVSNSDRLTYMPFPWFEPPIIQAQKNELLQRQINGLVALEAIPVLLYTPLLYLMLNGTPRGFSGEPTPYPRIVSSLDVMHLYHLVETLFTTNDDKEDAVRIGKARIQFEEAIKKTKAAVKIALSNVPNGDDYAKQLFEHIREHNGDPNSLASLENDQEILTNLARIYISYQINYIHALEVFLVRLLMPAVDTEKMDQRYFTCPALPAAHPDGLFNSLIDNTQKESLFEESLVVLRQRAAQFNVKIMPQELIPTQWVCGSPAHFFRLLLLILTH